MTPEQAQAIYAAGEQAVIDRLCALDDQVQAAQQEIDALQRKLAQREKNSSTSSKRPSSDDITKPTTGAKNNAGTKNGKGNTIGGQPGHPKHTRPAYPPETLSKVHEHHCGACPHCASHDLLWLEDVAPRITQQSEIQEVVVLREEHRAYAYWCAGCGEIHSAELPEAVRKEGLFKARLTALVAYLKHVCHASFSTIRKFLRDVVGETVSRGYLVKLITKVSRSLERPYAELLERIPLETTLNVDETGHKDNGERFWTWVFKAELYVLFRIDKSRGSPVLIEVLGKEFEGTLGCDYFSAYRKFMKDLGVSVQFCLVHLIRDVKFLTTLPDLPTQIYGQRLLGALKGLFHVIHQHETLSEEAFAAALAAAKAEIIRIGRDAAPSSIDAKGRERRREAQNMAKRFRQHAEAYFTFITTPGMDPTNNLAEQAIRFVVIDRHVTQGTRGAKGRRASERLWTVIATCALQGRSAFAFILEAVEAFVHDRPAPSLLPAPP
ncbi:IS66 family transposase [Halochromatium glycolicum]|uniref:IS66 family transposase n=1 Tax=Halochromatium glycolicum TaxID=85075 RepID=A0AAJ0XCG5_9GAMM|nr:IS66 family transposase [Halochromatium glycolicum]MBK1707358.1 IS66 family transposase [Halochromatium glycolicum]